MSSVAHHGKLGLSVNLFAQLLIKIPHPDARIYLQVICMGYGFSLEAIEAVALVGPMHGHLVRLRDLKWIAPRDNKWVLPGSGEEFTTGIIRFTGPFC